MKCSETAWDRCPWNLDFGDEKAPSDGRQTQLRQASTAKKEFTGWERVFQGTRSFAFQMYFIYKELNPFKTTYIPHRLGIALLLN